MFIPTTKQELNNLGWNSVDIILVTGDSYIDSPLIGVAVIGKVLINAGYRVGIIAQPDINSETDICRLGEPELFWGVSGGSIDSMVANFTALKKRRKTDDYTPGGENKNRPDRAVIVYSNLIRRYSKSKKPIVLGGIEASLRRIAQYDFWENKVRRSILFDAKADIIIYGMGEKSVIELAGRIKSGQDIKDIRGICYISKDKNPDYIELPPFETVAKDKSAFINMFHSFYSNNDPVHGQGLYQLHGDRYLIHNPPQPCLMPNELDEIYNLEFEREVHPFYNAQGNVRAIETVRFSITTHRGCFGECNFCSICVHEGRTIISRSEESILKEAHILTKHREFKGYIQNVGGPTANMYGLICKKKLKKGACPDKRCLYPAVCNGLALDHGRQIHLLKNLRKIPGIKKAFVASGVRYDLVLADNRHGNAYLEELIEHHISGQMKLAPEHTENSVLNKMGKSDSTLLLEFKNRFYTLNKSYNKKQFLTYYLIAAHPGCREHDMRKLKTFASDHLKINPEQVQIFTPTPSTYSSLMYYTESDPFTGEKIFVEKDPVKRENQKNILTDKTRIKR